MTLYFPTNLRIWYHRLYYFRRTHTINLLLFLAPLVPSYLEMQTRVNDYMPSISLLTRLITFDFSKNLVSCHHHIHKLHIYLNCKVFTEPKKGILFLYWSCMLKNMELSQFFKVSGELSYSGLVNVLLVGKDH